MDLRPVDFPTLRLYCATNGETDKISMRVGRGMNSDLKPATLRQRRPLPRGLVRALYVAAVTLLLLSTGDFAQAQSLRQGISAFNRQDYARASQVFIPLAERGEASAQAYLGFMFETGRGVPQNYTEAAMWYRRAAEQGDSLAQYSLGLLYDRGQGVPRDIVEANKWLNLSTAGAPRRAREARARLRALEWAPVREQ